MSGAESTTSNPVQADQLVSSYGKATGILKCWGQKFSAVFLISGQLYIFAGTLHGNGSLFDSPKVTLYYGLIDQLSGEQVFTGSIGITDFKFLLGSGSTMGGTLSDGEQVIPVFTISNGKGTWFKYT